MAVPEELAEELLDDDELEDELEDEPEDELEDDLEDELVETEVTILPPVPPEPLLVPSSTLVTTLPPSVTCNARR